MLGLTFARSHISLFIVSKSIHDESRDVFFEVNTVVLGLDDNLPTFIGLHGPHVRYLRFGEAGPRSMRAAEKHLRPEAKLTNVLASVMANAQSLPQLSRITLDVTGIESSVRQLLEQAAPLDLCPEDLQCIDIGRYVLTTANGSTELRFEYPVLVQLWTSLVQRENGFFSSLQDLATRFREADDPYMEFEKPALDLKERYRETVLAVTVCFYQNIEHQMSAVDLEAGLRVLTEATARDRSWRAIATKGLMQKSVEVAHRVRLQDVRVGHSSDVLEWATELLVSFQAN